MNFDFTEFQFLRPEWFYAFIPLLLLLVLLWRRRLSSRNWQALIDPKLLPHVLVGQPGKTGYFSLLLLFITASLAIVAAAGPAWQRLPQPVFKSQSALVIALDLSRSMNAEDIQPSRLQRALFKLRDILALRRDGQTALVVYANDAFTVTPLTDDSRTIDAMIPAISTSLLPAQGNNTAAALNKAVELMKNAAVNHGDILLVTDDINPDTDFFSDIHRQGYRISILGIGTADGAPIALASGGFVKDDDGGIVISKLDSSLLAEAARKGGGRYSNLTSDERDITYLLGNQQTLALNTHSTQTDLKTDTWQEEGPWLLLLVIPLAALAFRKGYLVFVLVLLLPVPNTSHAFSWDELWRNNNQRAEKDFAAQNYSAATEKFTHPEWKAAAQYRAGDYAQAAQTLQSINTAEAHYNRGNALAKSGNIPAAIAAYDEALKLEPQHEDALFNKNLLQKKQDASSDQQQNNQQGSQQQDNQQQDSSGQSNGQESNSASDSSGDKNKQDSTAQQQNAQSQKPDEQKQHPSSEQAAANQKDEIKPDKTDSENESTAAQTNEQQPDSQQQAMEQKLRQIPDDPGGLLRRKFQYQYQKQSKESRDNAW